MTMKLDGGKLIAITILVFLAAFLRIAESTTPPFACDSSDPQTESFKFCRTGLPIPHRARDLVSRLTIDEKISQLVNQAAGVPRLGIPAYQWWSESLHGVSNAGKGISYDGVIRSATSFPQAILSAASFDELLFYRIGQVIGTEARAVYNQGQGTGMTFWAPNINIFRDPRWGRGQETPGEDPMLTGKYAVAYVRGVQGDSFQGGMLKHGELKASSCCKHFTAYDLDNWNGVTRFDFNAIVTKQDMADTFQPPFRSCIHEGRASGIMCSYNSVNGIPSCASTHLLTHTARKQWGFRGYITSDCDAVAVMHDNHKYAKTPEDAVAYALKAGMDVDCGDYLLNYTKSALDQKKITEHDIDRALRNLFTVRMRLGLFNGDPSKLKYGHIGADQVCSKEHQDVALEAARNGIVLLKNKDNHLPLSKDDISSLAVIGPNGNNANVMLGNYAGPPCISVEVYKAMQNYVENTVFYEGCNAVNCTYAEIDEAVKIAKEADYVVLVMGLDQGEEEEALDREVLTLPGQQEELITAVAHAAKKPVVLVLLCGGSVDISFAKHHHKIGSILWAGYPGQAGGIALSEIIFGDHNPGGRLPMTWYPQDFIRIPMTDMRMRPDSSSGYPGRTYRFYTGKKVFEFGYGLSYSTYAYNFANVPQSALYLKNFTAAQARESSNAVRHVLVSEMSAESCENAKFSAVVSVENAGDLAGKHPVLLFVRQEKPSNGSPVKQLIGFRSVSLNAGAKAEIEFTISPCEHLSSATEDGLMVLEEGSRFLSVGDKEYPINVAI